MKYTKFKELIAEAIDYWHLGRDGRHYEYNPLSTHPKDRRPNHFEFWRNDPRYKNPTLPRTPAEMVPPEHGRPTSPLSPAFNPSRDRDWGKGPRKPNATQDGRVYRGIPKFDIMNPNTYDTRPFWMMEAILKGASARRSVLLRKSKEAKKQKSKFDTEMRLAGGNPQTAALYVKPPEPSPMAPLKARKTEKHGVVVGGKKDFSASAKAVGANKKNAQSILDIFHEKPHGTRITVYGKKYGKNADHAMKISKKRMMGNDVHVVHGTDRIVHLNPSGAGLQVIDARTRRILLDKGHDAEW